jgi:Restriction endonuclease
MSGSVIRGGVKAGAIRYIKLGAGGRWEKSALDKGRIDWGLPSDPHDIALEGNWTAVTAHYASSGLAPAVATGYTNEAKAFYTNTPDALWITFARGRMWWAFAESDIHWLGGDGSEHGTRYRNTVDGWHDSDVAGCLLNTDRLSTRLTQLAAYRRTSCQVKERELCLRYINAEPDVDATAVAEARLHLEQAVQKLIAKLDWADFELLVDLILTRSGWHRVSSLGGMLKDVDLIMEQPLTGERMAIQIKSSANQQVIDDYAVRLAARTEERLMLICHSPIGKLIVPQFSDQRSLTIMTPSEIADRAIGCGLTNWIADHAK